MLFNCLYWTTWDEWLCSLGSLFPGALGVHYLLWVTRQSSLSVPGTAPWNAEASAGEEWRRELSRGLGRCLGWGGECCFSRLLECRAARQEQAPAGLGSGATVRAQRVHGALLALELPQLPCPLPQVPPCHHPVQLSHTASLCLFQHRVFVVVWF